MNTRALVTGSCLGPPSGRRSAKLPGKETSPTFNYKRASYPALQKLSWTRVIKAGLSKVPRCAVEISDL
jgi:hypothetical protein